VNPTANNGDEASGQNITKNAANGESTQAVSDHEPVVDHWYDNATSSGLEKLRNTDNGSSLGVGKHVIQNYINTFFTLIYPTSFLGFFHQATFLREWHTKSIDLGLLKAVCACSSHFSTEGRNDEQCTIWIQEVETDALQNIGHFAIVRLQILVLLIFYHFRFRRSSKVWMFSAIAARLAYAKRLNHENNSLPQVIQESRRRLMWSIYIIDKFYSGGVPELTLCAPEDMHIRLPCNERLFEFGIPSNAPYLAEEEHMSTASLNDESKDMGVLAYYIQLLSIRHRILRYVSSPLHHTSFSRKSVFLSQFQYIVLQAMTFHFWVQIYSYLQR